MDQTENSAILLRIIRLSFLRNRSIKSAYLFAKLGYFVTVKYLGFLYKVLGKLSYFLLEPLTQYTD